MTSHDVTTTHHHPPRSSSKQAGNAIELERQLLGLIAMAALFIALSSSPDTVY
jgi:hypothetical protein